MMAHYCRYMRRNGASTGLGASIMCTSLPWRQRCLVPGQTIVYCGLADSEAEALISGNLVKFI
jgi:hypothetical protein